MNVRFLTFSFEILNMPEEAQQVNLTYDMLALDTARRIRDTRQDKAAYADNVEFACNLALSYLPIDIRRKMEYDLKLLRDEIARIKKEEKNEVSRKQRIDELRAEFASLHEPYFMVTFSRMGITKPKEDGVIEFDTMGMEKWAAIVQDRRSGLIKAVEKQVEKDAPTDANIRIPALQANAALQTDESNGSR